MRLSKEELAPHLSEQDSRICSEPEGSDLSQKDPQSQGKRLDTPRSLEVHFLLNSCAARCRRTSPAPEAGTS